jgi:hypothetical protein
MSNAQRLPDHLRARNVLRDLVGAAALECAMRSGEREWHRSHERAPHYTTRPGAFLQRQPDDVRALLQHLRSDDLANETMVPWNTPATRRWRSSMVRMPGTCPGRQTYE